MSDLILLAHGGGGTLTRQLIQERVLARFGNPTLETLVRLLRLYGRLDSLAEALAGAEVSPMAVLEEARG